MKKGPDYDEESNIYEDISVDLALPEGKTITHKCKSGETVLNIKKKLYDDKLCNFKVNFTYNGKVLLDPLCLVDCGINDGAVITVVEAK